jgi:quercetin dioxygenase-like cupin family protein
MASGMSHLGGKLSDLPLSPQSTPQVDKRIVFGPDRFWPEYTARHFTAKVGSVITTHAHDWPHYILVFSGTVEARIGDDIVRADEKSWIHVPANVPHSFTVVGDVPFEFVCIVPARGDVPPPQK